MKLIKEVFENIIKLIKEHLVLFIIIFFVILGLFVTPYVIDGVKRYERRHDDILVQYLDLDMDHVYKKMTWEEFDKALADKETFIVYMGYEGCHACQNVVPLANELFKDLDIKEVKYIYFDFAGDRETKIREEKMWNFMGTPLFLYVIDGEAVFSNQEDEFRVPGETIYDSVVKATNKYLELIK